MHCHTFIPAVPDVPEVVAAVQFLLSNNNCEVHMILRSNVDRDKRSLTNYTVKANEVPMSPNLTYINDAWISSQFKVPSCEPQNISVRANNSCGQSGKSEPSVLIRDNLDVNVPTAESVACSYPIDTCTCPTEPPCKSMVRCICHTCTF